MSNIFSIVLLSTIIALITVSCNADVSEKEDEIVRAALDKIYEDGDEPNLTPEEVSQK